MARQPLASAPPPSPGPADWIAAAEETFEALIDELEAHIADKAVVQLLAARTARTFRAVAHRTIRRRTAERAGGKCQVKTTSGSRRAEGGAICDHVTYTRSAQDKAMSDRVPTLSNLQWRFEKCTD